MTLVINWWVLPLESLCVIVLLIFIFKVLCKFTVTSPINREMIYTCIGCHSSLEWTKKPAKNRIKYKKLKNKTIIIIIIIIVLVIIIALYWMEYDKYAIFTLIYIYIYIYICSKVTFLKPFNLSYISYSIYIISMYVYTYFTDTIWFLY